MGVGASTSPHHARPGQVLRGALLMLLAQLGLVSCTEAPEVVAIAALERDGGPGDSLDGGTAGDSGALASLWSGRGGSGCDYNQALLDARIPPESVFVGLRCEVPRQEIEASADEAARQQLVADLINNTTQLEPRMGSPIAAQCQEGRGLWWLDGQVVRLCPTLCGLVGQFVFEAIASKCAAAGTPIDAQPSPID